MLTLITIFQQIKQELSALSKKDHSQYDCCVVIMLSHGTEVRLFLSFYKCIESVSIFVFQEINNVIQFHCIFSGV